MRTWSLVSVPLQIGAVGDRSHIPGPRLLPPAPDPLTPPLCSPRAQSSCLGSDSTRQTTRLSPVFPVGRAGGCSHEDRVSMVLGLLMGRSRVTVGLPGRALACPPREGGTGVRGGGRARQSPTQERRRGSWAAPAFPAPRAHPPSLRASRSRRWPPPPPRSLPLSRLLRGVGHGPEVSASDRGLVRDADPRPSPPPQPEAALQPGPGAPTRPHWGGVRMPPRAWPHCTGPSPAWTPGGGLCVRGGLGGGAVGTDKPLLFSGLPVDGQVVPES